MSIKIKDNGLMDLSMFEPADNGELPQGHESHHHHHDKRKKTKHDPSGKALRLRRFSATAKRGRQKHAEDPTANTSSELEELLILLEENKEKRGGAEIRIATQSDKGDSGDMQNSGSGAEGRDEWELVRYNVASDKVGIKRKALPDELKGGAEVWAATLELLGLRNVRLALHDTKHPQTAGMKLNKSVMELMLSYLTTQPNDAAGRALTLEQIKNQLLAMNVQPSAMPELRNFHLLLPLRMLSLNRTRTESQKQQSIARLKLLIKRYTE